MKILLLNKITTRARHWGLTPIILVIQDAEIKRIMVQSQTRQIAYETLSQKSPSQKRAGGVAQGTGPGFKPQYRKNKQIKKTYTTNTKKNLRPLGSV
jgi:hypothetical protein